MPRSGRCVATAAARRVRCDGSTNEPTDNPRPAHGGVVGLYAGHPLRRNALRPALAQAPRAAQIRAPAAPAHAGEAAAAPDALRELYCKSRDHEYVRGSKVKW